MIDVIEGRGPHPLIVLAYIQRLPDTSMTMALLSGGREYFGWGVDRYLAADTFDALNLNTRATGMWKKKAPDFPAWPRPADAKKKKKAKKSDKPKPLSVADLHAQFMSRR